MGPRVFIAKTLLQRTGAFVEFRNEKDGSTVVLALWPRAELEAAGYSPRDQIHAPDDATG